MSLAVCSLLPAMKRFTYDIPDATTGCFTKNDRYVRHNRGEVQLSSKTALLLP